MNAVVIDLNSTDGSIKPVCPKQHFIHRIVRQALDSFVIVLYVIKQKVIYLTFEHNNNEEYLITFNDIFNRILTRFIVEFDAENVAMTMTPVGEEKFICCGIVGESGQLGRIVGIQRQLSGLASIGEDFKLIANGKDEICTCLRKTIFNT